MWPVCAADLTVPSGLCVFGLGGTGALERLGIVIEFLWPQISGASSLWAGGSAVIQLVSRHPLLTAILHATSHVCLKLFFGSLDGDVGGSGDDGV